MSGVPKRARTPAPDKTLMRSLGEFFGEVWKGIAADPDPKQARRVVRRGVEQEVRETPAGKVILRRTTIDEVILPDRRDATEAPRPKGPGGSVTDR